MNKKSFLKYGNCNKRLKHILVTSKQFCLVKRCPICYKMDFQNTFHVVAFIVRCSRKLYRLSRNDANSALRSAKKDYYVNKFSNNHRNPKASWKTMNDILGRSKKQDVIKEIKLPEKTVTSTEEFVYVLNEH